MTEVAPRAMARTTIVSTTRPLLRYNPSTVPREAPPQPTLAGCQCKESREKRRAKLLPVLAELVVASPVFVLLVADLLGLLQVPPDPVPDVCVWRDQVSRGLVWSLLLRLAESCWVVSVALPQLRLPRLVRLSVDSTSPWSLAWVSVELWPVWPVRRPLLVAGALLPQP